jgi:hypothetical protein
MNEMQCWHCGHFLFFKPLPDEAFLCCKAHSESVGDIDLRKGYSPAIERHGIDNVPCYRFLEGVSICKPDSLNPFKLHDIRVSGEKEILTRMKLA